jgi:penicillin amidase
MRKLFGVSLLVVVVVLMTGLLAGYLMLRGSLPYLRGEQALPGLSAPARIQRDALGVVTIEAASHADAVRTLGYVHAQERYFEMDLMRRNAAGELAELLGPAALEHDKQLRLHRLRTRVGAQMTQILGDQRGILEAYRDGIMAGLGDLRTRPWPYLLLRQQPSAWTLEDSALVALTMYADLQNPANQRELAMARLREALPPPLFSLLNHAGSEWDAALFGQPHGNATLPGADILNLRRLPGAAATFSATPPEDAGSNNFAVAGHLTADGRAIVADDMHLSLRAPNIWFRARLRYPDAQAPGGRVDITGFTLPGLPAVIVGSNGHVAWGFTNSYIDTADFARLPASAATAHNEIIRVAGATPVQLPVRETYWGPVVDSEPDGQLLALRWSAQLPGAVKLDFIDMARASNLDDAFAIADRAGIPAQNMLAADSHGRIGWRIIGTRPQRNSGCSADMFPQLEASLDTSLINICTPWPLRSDQAPTLVDPASGRLWTANNRIVDGATLAEVGNGGYALGARARQIRDQLFAREIFNEQNLLDIQLDDRALLLERWWKLLREVIEHHDDPALQRLEEASRHWEGHAAVDSASYRITRSFRGMILDAIEAGLLAPARAKLGEAYLSPSLPQLEGVAWPLLQQRPLHLLPPRYASWDALLIEVAQALQKDLITQGPMLTARTWGERNTSRICHPLASALPSMIATHLCMPAAPLPGDRDMPRVQGPAFGASQRMVVAPGHERDGIVHMPGGQSGHPLSPFWGAGHEDWVQGRSTPFLPGPSRYTMTLLPQ